MDKMNEFEARLKARMEAVNARLADRMAALDEKMGAALGDRSTSPSPSAATASRNVVQTAPRQLSLVARGSRVKVALCVGLNEMDAQAYVGYRFSTLSGCEVDVQRFKCVLEKLGFGVATLLNREATCQAVYQNIQEIAAALNPGDLFVFHISGHGGREVHGDKLRENWCLYDGFVWDDDIVWMFSRFKPGVRVLVINDQCHSGGIFQQKLMQRSADVAQLCVRDGRPRDWNAELAMESPDFPMLIQFAGCRAEQESIDGLGGGTWTQALINVLEESFGRNNPCTYRTWFDKAFCSPTLKRGSQDPQWVESRQVTDDFRERMALD